MGGKKKRLDGEIPERRILLRMRHIVSALVVSFILIGMLVAGVHAQSPETPQVNKAVSWSYGGVQVFLVCEGMEKFRLVIITGNEYTVFYRSRRSSRVDISMELEPEESSTQYVRYYNFTHRFSRTTVWMAIEFKKKGRRINALTRTFYGDIYKVVPNEKFLMR